jgi:lysophospholipase L1-like esterase
MEKICKNGFFTAFLTIILSVGAFYAFKALLPETLFAKPTQNEKYDNIAKDEQMISAMQDSLNVDADSTVAETPDIYGLLRFFKKLFTLEKTKKGTVRIAYFGDSMIESDLIVKDIRKYYQKKYGGSGIGFIPLSSLSTYLGGSIRYEYSPEWSTYSALKESTAATGISEYVSFANAGASVWTRYKSGSFPLVRPTLFYGKSDNSGATMTVTTDKGTLKPVQLKPTKALNKRLLASKASELTVQFDNAESIPFYGVNFSGGYGVNIDDFALRGSSGIPLKNFNVNLMNAFNRELKYDLIILQFGANVLSSKVTNYDWYASGMAKVVKHLKKCFPGTDILVISQADKATKYGKELKTDTTLAALIQAQEKYARNTGSAFLNLFELMGGEGSMLKWAKESPSLAVSDFTHFNSNGAKRIAELIFEKLEQEYETFKIQNNLYGNNTGDKNE